MGAVLAVAPVLAQGASGTDASGSGGTTGSGSTGSGAAGSGTTGTGTGAPDRTGTTGSGTVAPNRTGATGSGATGTGGSLGTSQPSSPRPAAASEGSWTELQGRVVGVNRSANTVEIEEQGSGVRRSVPITGDVEMFDRQSRSITMDKIREGQSLRLRNTPGSPTAPATGTMP